MIVHPIHLDTPHRRVLAQAAEVLENGGLVVYPTDTQYGLGCSMYHKKAIERLYKVKGKSKFQAMSLICTTLQDIDRYAHVDNTTFRILKRCFPGPYTVVLDAKKEIAKLMLSRRKELGVRIPDCPVCMGLVELLGHPILNTSIPGPAISEPDHELLDAGVADMFLDAGVLPHAGESTVVHLVDGQVEVLREGKGNLDVFNS